MFHDESALQIQWDLQHSLTRIIYICVQVRLSHYTMFVLSYVVGVSCCLLYLTLNQYVVTNNHLCTYIYSYSSINRCFELWTVQVFLNAPFVMLDFSLNWNNASNFDVNTLRSILPHCTYTTWIVGRFEGDLTTIKID